MAFIKDYAVYKFPFGWLQVEYIGGTVISLDKLDEVFLVLMTVPASRS